MQRLQIQLLCGLGRHELHRRALHGFGNRFGIIEVVLLSLAIGTNIFGRHQPGIVTKRCEFAAQVMCADAGFHADQARRYIGEPHFHLAPRPFLPQHDGAACIVAHDVERVLADIDADHGDCGIGGLRHGELLVLAPLASLSLAGQEHGRTIPLPDFQAHLESLSYRWAVSMASLVVILGGRHAPTGIHQFDRSSCRLEFAIGVFPDER
jgi:hypothetical protein